jgi:hypothetical protein
MSGVALSPLLTMIQSGYLERRIQESLKPSTLYRQECMPEEIKEEAGQTITKTRKSLIEPVLTPLTPGVDPAPVDSFQIEQWIAAPTQYGIPIDTHLPSSAVAIVNKFLEDFDSLIQNAAWTMNRLPRNAFYRAYCGGQTLTTEAAAASAAVKVAAIAGFRYVLGPDGKLAQVSAGTPLNVTVDGTDNTVTGAVPLDPRFPDGPGTLTLGTPVTVAVRKAILATNRPFVMRPGGENNIDALTGASILTSTMLVNSVARMRANRVPTFPDGLYHIHLDPIQLAQLFQDQPFQRLYQASPRAPEFVKGVIVEQYGLLFVIDDDNPNYGNVTATLTGASTAGTSAVYAKEIGAEVVNAKGLEIKRSIILGAKAMYEAYIDEKRYLAQTVGLLGPYGYNGEVPQGAAGYQAMVNRVRYVLRPPQDRYMQTISQAWSSTCDFTPPSDALARTSAATFKRAMVLESVG